MLTAAIANRSNKYQHDLSGDDSLDNADMLSWLANGGFLPGDANVDGVVDGVDFTLWNANRFQAVNSWCQGDFNSDGFVDGQDFIVWNAFKFQSVDVASSLESTGLAWIVLLSGLVYFLRR